MLGDNPDFSLLHEFEIGPDEDVKYPPKGSYRYLAESIRRHPDQATLLRMMQDAGFEGCRYHNLMGGIVAVHRGYRY